LLGALVAGALPAAERAAIVNHAASCDRCHALIEGLVETGAANETLPTAGARLVRRDGHTAGALELGRGTRAGRDGLSDPMGTAPDTPEFGGTDRFAVVRRIGAGGMGVVYEVWDREREAPFALKTLRGLSPHRLSLFKNEFRALRGLSHRNLVTLGELVKDRGHWFFTMELVDGIPSWRGQARSIRRQARGSTRARCARGCGSSRVHSARCTGAARCTATSSHRTCW
jgi:hypothetical protein